MFYLVEKAEERDREFVLICMLYPERVVWRIGSTYFLSFYLGLLCVLFGGLQLQALHVL
eukprot:c19225_g1_i1 orf=266-442(+)